MPCYLKLVSFLSEGVTVYFVLKPKFLCLKEVMFSYALFPLTIYPELFRLRGVCS